MARPRKSGERYPGGKDALFVVPLSSESYRLQREADQHAREWLDEVFPTNWPAVYVMSSDASGVVKVGYSKNPKRRISDMQSHNQDVLRVFWVVRVKDDGARKLERTFHRLCQGTKHHVRGEWYAIKPEIAVKTLKAIAGRLKLETHADDRYGTERGL